MVRKLGFVVVVSGSLLPAMGPVVHEDAKLTASGTDAGSVYVFVRNGTSWSEQAKLTASDAAEGDHFGKSVELSGDTAVLGANRDDDNGNNSGSAYVFVRNGTGWSEHSKLTASDAAEGDRFGVRVTVSGDTAVVGAWLDDHAGGMDTGSAYVFRVPAGEDGDVPAVSNIGVLLLLLAMLGTGVYFVRRRATS